MKQLRSTTNLIIGAALGGVLLEVFDPEATVRMLALWVCIGFLALFVRLIAEDER